MTAIFRDLRGEKEERCISMYHLELDSCFLYIEIYNINYQSTFIIITHLYQLTIKRYSMEVLQPSYIPAVPLYYEPTSDPVSSSPTDTNRNAWFLSWPGQKF